MADTAWTLDGQHGELLIHTGVTGRAAKMGHRLTIAMRHWRATVRWADGEPATAELTVAVDSLEVLHGEGGVTPLSGPEKALVRSNALRSLDARRYPQIRFAANTVEPTADGYRLTGELDIHGTTRRQVIELRTTNSGAMWELSSKAAVRQSDFGVRPYSMMMGALKVADEVTVTFHATRATDT
ncbi:YceI family protein [Mycobacterium talmoniae]|uniref:S-adenosyl-L-methionine-dependent methyltransferase n=2 Tax=Mycobacterium talmoniae TaxID=1858794 RepID=A0A1S1NFH3_9MYCO|nr:MULTISPECIES: YceI family protein [Mycobacterium]OHU99220.1 S-adenosyl-L-methionine-dependent methyltransferase [Mycobacterium talmoniae]TDH57229.1 YceI family protein [Mycobacterium eburneum]